MKSTNINNNVIYVRILIIDITANESSLYVVVWDGSSEVIWKIDVSSNHVTSVHIMPVPTPMETSLRGLTSFVANDNGM